MTQPSKDVRLMLESLRRRRRGGVGSGARFMITGNEIGADGATHCGAYDIAYLTTLPGMVMSRKSRPAVRA